MPSVLGLLEERERAARQRVEVLEGELREAEAVWERFVIARETVAAVLQEPDGGEGIAPTAAAPAGDGPVRNAASVPGSVVPHWNDGLAPTLSVPETHLRSHPSPSRDHSPCTRHGKRART